MEVVVDVEVAPLATVEATAPATEDTEDEVPIETTTIGLVEVEGALVPPETISMGTDDVEDTVVGVVVTDTGTDEDADVYPLCECRL